MVDANILMDSNVLSDINQVLLPNPNNVGNVVQQVNSAGQSLNVGNFLMNIPMYLWKLFQASPYVILIFIGLVALLYYFGIKNYASGYVGMLLSFLIVLLGFSFIAPFLLPLLLGLVIK